MSAKGQMEIQIALDPVLYSDKEIRSTLENDAPPEVNVSVVCRVHMSLDELFQNLVIIKFAIAAYVGKKLLGPSLDVIGNYLANLVKKILEKPRQNQLIRIVIQVDGTEIHMHVKAEHLIDGIAFENLLGNLSTVIESQLMNIKQLNAKLISVNCEPISMVTTPDTLYPQNIAESNVWYKWDSAAQTWHKNT
ncbi:MAG: hypothetical protein V1784_01015 [bacterium]